MPEITVLYGYKLLPRLTAVVRAVNVIKRGWFFKHTVQEFYIDSDFCTLGPFDDEAEAAWYAMMLRRI